MYPPCKLIRLRSFFPAAHLPCGINIDAERPLQLQGEIESQQVRFYIEKTIEQPVDIPGSGEQPQCNAQKKPQAQPPKTAKVQPRRKSPKTAHSKRQRRVTVWSSVSARRNAQLASTIFAPKCLPSTARNAVVLILTGLILVMQNAQYDGGGISSVQDSDVWSGRDADTFRGGGHDQSTRNSRLKRSMISGGVSERVQSRSDLALVVSSF